MQVWGTDVELARRVPWLARPLLRHARLVLAASSFLVEQAWALGAREVRVVPSGVRIPEDVGEPEEPPHVLYVGRLSAEKSILEFLEATEGLPRVIVGDGPLRARVPEAVGFVPPGELGPWYERAAVVCVPSRREGYGVVAREAMAWGRPVVAAAAAAAGGLVDVVEDAATGVVVLIGDTAALRAAVLRLLRSRELRERYGDAGRRHAASSFAFAAVSRLLVEVYREAAGHEARANRRRPPGGDA